jgi:hypothetical protein
LFTAGNFISKAVRGRSLLSAATEHRRLFTGMAKGGIFLIHGDDYLRLEYDTSQIIRSNEGIRIRKDVCYTYWNDLHHDDTLHCAANMDTVTLYKLDYMVPPGGSNLKSSEAVGKVDPLVLISESLFSPLFREAGSPMLILASFENAGVIIALILTACGFILSRKQKLIPLAFVMFAVFISLLAGYTTPNSGAIFRYRAPALIFLFAAALYYHDLLRQIRRKEPL